jgi:carbon dioxide concentrating mechanism protein CcmN
MSLPPLPLLCDSHFCVSGTVTIHRSAAIAPGVLLQADPGSQITIAAEVCIGAGTILHAHAGDLAIEAGATLGAGVLIVGSGKIGKNACVGTGVLIWQSSIEPEQVIAAGSIIGDSGRQANENLPLPAPAAADSVSSSSLTANPPRGAAPIYGQAAVTRLLDSLFPHRQALNGLPPASPSSDHAQSQ